MHERGADIVAECLVRLGVERVYGVIGTSIVGLLDGLYRVRDRIRYVSCRHEQIAASMADAEGRLTRRPGVVVLHSGPGALNAMISLANAAKDCSPLIAITGATKRRLRGCNGMLELDHVRVFRPLCRAVVRVESVLDIPAACMQAYAAAVSGPGGPVLIEIPEDVWTDRGPASCDDCKPTASSPAAPPAASVADIVTRLLRSSRPVFLAGAGVAYAGAHEMFRQLVERTQIPTITTGNGRGVLSETHPLCLGRVGYGGGNVVADEALRRADFILGIGCTLSDLTTYEYTWPIGGDVVVVNLDDDNEGKKIPVESIQADAGLFLEQLLLNLPSGNRESKALWLSELEPAREMWKNLLAAALHVGPGFGSPAAVCQTLDAVLRPDAIVTVGAGMHLLYPSAFLKTRQPGSYLSAVNFGSMGFGLAAALAAQMIYPERQVVAILGDGDFLMTVQDLETAVRESLPIKIFVVNDNAYRVLAFRQRVQFDGHVYGSTHNNPNLLKLADSFGIQAWRLDSVAATEEIVHKVLTTREPTLVEVVTDPDNLPPTNLQAAMRMSE